MNATNGKDLFHKPKHRDDSNAAWGRCQNRDDNRAFYKPRHAKPVPMIQAGGVA